MKTWLLNWQNHLVCFIFSVLRPVLHIVLQYCHTSFAVSHKLVQTAFCAPSVRLIAVAGLLQYAVLFCCHDIAHVVVAFFFLCRCPGLQFRNSTILKLAVPSFKRVTGLEAEMLQKQKSPQGTHIGSPFPKNVYNEIHVGRVQKRP